MKKKIVLLTLIGLLAVGGVVSAASLWGTYKGFPKVRLTLGGQAIATQGTPAINLQGSTMVPLSALKSAGVSYTYDAKKQTVDLKPAGANLVKLTEDVMALGGDGITLTDIEGDMTAVVYYPSMYGFDEDWTDIDQIFKKTHAARRRIHAGFLHRERRREHDRDQNVRLRQIPEGCDHGRPASAAMDYERSPVRRRRGFGRRGNARLTHPLSNRSISRSGNPCYVRPRTSAGRSFFAHFKNITLDF
ncbi:hypothetical protein [Cohnella rhizosphaerae]|uniref:Copper amine oxidase-like N-terminal domain-containing protein n=1 Tax=Cohnella rhizosphaerae TaxID=1457232 RepID=A0A9X4QUL1_9BACL|nr:hypothetical protein [Cohnella rhizosphaerae]MDG0812381.1 hypothetical protein [Cohnella rhizosphaerae]